jgi:hypothetical protein
MLPADIGDVIADGREEVCVGIQDGAIGGKLDDSLREVDTKPR